LDGSFVHAYFVFSSLSNTAMFGVKTQHTLMPES